MSNKYLCTTCGGVATKPPLRALKEWQSAQPSAFDGLGTWNCKNCGTKIKVKREK